MSDFDLTSFVKSLFGLGGDQSQPQQPPPSLLPPSGGQGALGVTQAQIPSWDQYNKDRSSFGGILSGMLSHGIGPGLGAAVAPDSIAAGDYNSGLGKGIETALHGMTLQGYRDMQARNGGGAPTVPGAINSAMPGQQPSYVPQVPGAQPASAPTAGAPLTGASLLPPQGNGAGSGSAPAGPNLLAPPGSQPPPDDASAAPPSMPAMPAMPAAQPSAGAGRSSQPPPLFNVSSLAQQYQIAARTPSMDKQASAILSLIEKGVPEGAYVATDGSLQSRPGYGQYVAGKAYNESFGKGAGTLPYAGAIKAAEANAQNASDLRYKPAIAGETARLELPYKTALERSKYIELKTDQSIADPMRPDAQGNPSIIAHGTTSEQVKRGNELGESYAATFKGGAAADDLRERIQYIQREMPGAIKGSLADQKIELGRLAIGLGVPKETVDSALGSVSKAEVLQKQFYRITTDQVKGLGREPGYILDKIASANPNIETQPDAMLLMTNAVDQGGARMQDKRAAQDVWLDDPKHMKSLAGFETAFAKSNPPDMYVDKAYKATDGVPDAAKLIGTKNGSRVWEMQDGTRVMARH